MTLTRCLTSLLCAFLTVALVSCSKTEQDDAAKDESETQNDQSETQNIAERDETAAPEETEATGAPVSYIEYKKTHEKLYSQFDEEIITRHFFSDRRDGFYLDVGCAWAMKSSTTYYLEERLGWTGIGIDALESYRPKWDEMRPKSTFIAYAITDHSGDTITFYEAGPLSSVDEEWFDNFKNVEPKAIKVSTITLNDLLAEQGVEKVDFMSMDIEGAEPAALAGFDINRFGVELVCIEAHGSDDLENDILAYFEANNFELIDEYLPHDYANWYFRPKK